MRQYVTVINQESKQMGSINCLTCTMGWSFYYTLRLVNVDQKELRQKMLLLMKENIKVKDNRFVNISLCHQIHYNNL